MGSNLPQAMLAAMEHPERTRFRAEFGDKDLTWLKDNLWRFGGPQGRRGRWAAERIRELEDQAAKWPRRFNRVFAVIGWLAAVVSAVAAILMLM